MANLRIPIFDHKGDVSYASLPVDDAIIDANITDIFGGVEAVIVGNTGQATLDLATPKDAGPGGNAAAKTAQIELKWLLQYHDAVTLDEHTLEVPCADASLLSAGTENMDLGAGAGATLKTEFEATAIAPVTGNAVVLDEAVLIGRNL